MTSAKSSPPQAARHFLESIRESDMRHVPLHVEEAAKMEIDHAGSGP
jgi:hypothetical protein